MSVLLTRSVWLLYPGVQQCSYLFPKRRSPSVQVMGAHLKTAYTKHFLEAICKGISQHSYHCFFLSNFTVIFCHSLNLFLFFLQAHPSFYFLFSPLVSSITMITLTLSTSFFSLKGPVAVSVIILLVQLRADSRSLLPSLFHNLDCPFVFILMK